MTVKCCVCTRIRIEDQWLKLEVHTNSDGLVSHTYCPVCFDLALAELDAQDTVGVASMPNHFGQSMGF